MRQLFVNVLNSLCNISLRTGLISKNIYIIDLNIRDIYGKYHYSPSTAVYTNFTTGVDSIKIIMVSYTIIEATHNWELVIFTKYLIQASSTKDYIT